MTATEEVTELMPDLDANLVCQAKHERVWTSGEVDSSGSCDILATYRFHDCTNRMLVCESFRQQTLTEVKDWSRCWACGDLHTNCIKFINI